MLCDYRPFQQAIALNNYAASLIEQAPKHKEAVAALSSSSVHPDNTASWWCESSMQQKLPRFCIAELWMTLGSVDGSPTH
jgi:hypothetical protein